MPWTGKEFKERHNKSLSSSQATKASKVADAILAKTGDEGKAIRIANAVAKRKKKHSSTTAAKKLYPNNP